MTTEKARRVTERELRTAVGLAGVPPALLPFCESSVKTPWLNCPLTFDIKLDPDGLVKNATKRKHKE